MFLARFQYDLVSAKLSIHPRIKRTNLTRRQHF